jgi:hypothetical protein
MFGVPVAGAGSPIRFQLVLVPVRRSSNQNSSLFSIRDIPASALHLNVPEVRYMLETLIVVLVVLWLLGMVSSYTIGGLIHLLLVLAVIVLIVRLLQGRRVV